MVKEGVRARCGRVTLVWHCWPNVGTSLFIALASPLLCVFAASPNKNQNLSSPAEYICGGVTICEVKPTACLPWTGTEWPTSQRYLIFTCPIMEVVWDSFQEDSIAYLVTCMWKWGIWGQMTSFFSSCFIKTKGKKEEATLTPGLMCLIEAGGNNKVAFNTHWVVLNAVTVLSPVYRIQQHRERGITKKRKLEN